MKQSLAEAHAALDRSRRSLASVLEGLHGSAGGLDALLTASAESMQALELARRAVDAAVADGALTRIDVSGEFKRECEVIADLIAIAHAQARRALGETEAEMKRVRGLRARLGVQKQRFEVARDCDVSA